MLPNGICTESILKKETPKSLWDSEIQTDHLVLAKRPYLVLWELKKNEKR